MTFDLSMARLGFKANKYLITFKINNKNNKPGDQNQQGHCKCQSTLWPQLSIKNKTLRHQIVRRMLLEIIEECLVKISINFYKKKQKYLHCNSANEDPTSKRDATAKKAFILVDYSI